VPKNPVKKIHFQAEKGIFFSCFHPKIKRIKVVIKIRKEPTWRGVNPTSPFLIKM